MQLRDFVNRPAALLAALSLAVAACGDSTAPDAPFDPMGMGADLTAVEGAFGGPVFNSYGVAFDALTDLSGTPVVSPAMLLSRDSAMQHLPRLSARIQGNVAGKPSFDLGELAGTTFEYNPTTDEYEPTERDGAPQNGVRFILYAVDPVTNDVIEEPLTEIGYVQLTFTETVNSATARLTIVSDGVTYFDYTVAATGTPTGVTAAIDGFIASGEERADFELTLQESGSEGNYVETVSYLIELPSRNFRIGATITYQEATDVSTLQFEVRGENGRITMNGAETEGVGTVTVRVNGRVFATIVNEGSTITITGADGQELTDDERDVLEFAFEMAEFGFFLLFAILLAPLSFLG